MSEASSASMKNDVIIREKLFTLPHAVPLKCLDTEVL
jgi:hypothetical protein